MKKLIILFVLINLLFMGCSNWIREQGNWGNEKPALETYKVGKDGSYNLDYLFTIPDTGVKIYRFIDMKHTRYIAIDSGITSVMSTTSSSKGEDSTEYNDTTIITVKSNFDKGK